MFTFVDFSQNQEFLSFVSFHTCKTGLKISQEWLFRLGLFFTQIPLTLMLKMSHGISQQLKKKSDDFSDIGTQFGTSISNISMKK